MDKPRRLSRPVRRHGLRRDFPARLARITLGLIVLAVLLGPLLWPHAADAVDLSQRNAPPSPAHPLGTDQLGRDLLARLFLGGRLTLAVGAAAMALSLILGTAIGLTAGLLPRVDGLLMRLTDLFLSLPLLPILLVAVMLFRDSLSATFGSGAGLFLLVVLGIGLTSWMMTARVVRGLTQSLAERDFITAARVAGASTPALITRHILPHCASAILVSATLGIANAILLESALSYLGLGFPADMPSWGRMFTDGLPYLRDVPGRALWPGAMISLTVLAVSYLGDGLRDRIADETGPRR